MLVLLAQPLAAQSQDGTGGQWVEEAGELDGHALFTTNYLPPPALRRQSADGYDIVVLQGLRLVPTQPGDQGINRALANLVREESAMECLAYARENWGGEGEWSVSILPEVLTDRWLGVVIASGNFCGGAHPNYWQHQQTYDRQTGALVDPMHWITSAGVTTERLEPAAEGEERITNTTITPALQDLILSHWPRTDDPDGENCRDVARDPFGWDLGLAPSGLAFMPELPHVAQACAETMVVPWGELAPYLSAEGQAIGADLTAP